MFFYCCPVHMDQNTAVMDTTLAVGFLASTVFFATKVQSLVSIEHNEEWFSKIQEKLKVKGLKNVDYRLIKKQKLDSELPIPNEISSVPGIDEFGYRSDYINYFTALNDYEDEYFDFIIVDGRARPECLFASMSKLKQNGLMILDNSERERYKICFKELSHWESINTTNGLTDTTFWVKP